MTVQQTLFVQIEHVCICYRCLFVMIVGGTCSNTTCMNDFMDCIITQLNENNHACWTYMMNNFQSEKHMCGFVTSTLGKLNDEMARNYAVCFIHRRLII